MKKRRTFWEETITMKRTLIELTAITSLNNSSMLERMTKLMNWNNLVTRKLNLI